MSFFSKGALRKAFFAVAVLTGVGIIPSPAVPEAQAAVSSAGAAAAASAAAAAAAAARARADREAENAVIVSPTDQNIARLQDRGIVDRTTIPYIRETVASMKVAPGTKEDDISYAQRDQFLGGLQDRRLVAEMSAASPQDATSKGLSDGLAPYFTATKAELGYSGPVTLPQARAMEKILEDKHWENDTKPFLEKTALVAGGVAVVGGVGFALTASRRRDYGY
jgi:hypothetical protein